MSLLSAPPSNGNTNGDIEILGSEPAEYNEGDELETTGIARNAANENRE